MHSICGLAGRGACQAGPLGGLADQCRNGGLRNRGRPDAQGADASVRDSEGRTALHHAVMRGHLGAVDALTAHSGPALLLQKDILGCTPVHLAAVQNQVTLILKLVTALLKDEGGRTPLHVIARQHCMQVRASLAAVKARTQALVGVARNPLARHYAGRAPKYATFKFFGPLKRGLPQMRPSNRQSSSASAACGPPWRSNWRSELPSQLAPTSGLSDLETSVRESKLLQQAPHVRTPCLSAPFSRRLQIQSDEKWVPGESRRHVCVCAPAQDFMGFLHLGWEVATRTDGECTVVQEETPAWAAAARKIDLSRPGLVRPAGATAACPCPTCNAGWGVATLTVGIALPFTARCKEQTGAQDRTPDKNCSVRYCPSNRVYGKHQQERMIVRSVGIKPAGGVAGYRATDHGVAAAAYGGNGRRGGAHHRAGAEAWVRSADALRQQLDPTALRCSVQPGAGATSQISWGRTRDA